MVHQNNEPIRVLHYIKHLGSGGGETLVYNIYKNIDRERVQFDFLVNTAEKEVLDDRISDLGGKKIVLLEKEPKFTPLKIVLCMRNLSRILKRGEHSIIHIHCSNGQGLLYAWIAKRAGVPVRIVHIHNTTVEGRAVHLKRLFHNICRKLFMDAPTDYFAASEMAARWLYSKEIVDNHEYTVIRNGIEPERYRFNLEIRNKMREEIYKKTGWKRKKIILNIGRMEEEKNQIFLLKVFNCICNYKDNKDDNYRLIIIGRGSLEKKIKDKCHELGLDDKVMFINYTDHVEQYMWASDLFLLPSLSEGLGIVVIEAQATGLRTIVSDTVPKEAYGTDLISSIDLDKDEENWAETIIGVLNNSSHQRESINYVSQVMEAGYDIRDTATKLQEYYLIKAKGLFKDEG